MNKLTQNVKTFKDLVLWMQEKLADSLCKELQEIMVELENTFERDSNLKGWESIGKRKRILTSLFGMEIKLERRGYRHRLPNGKAKYRYPLDELLGLSKEERFCPLVKHMAVGLAAKMSFREAAAFMRDYLSVAVSHQEIHHWVQDAGRTREVELQSEAESIFEHGEVPESEGRNVPVVVIEADGIWLHLQREQVRGAELKLGVLHEGWRAESPSKKRFRLVNKGAWAGFLRGQLFWERGAIRFAKRYNKVDRVVINGDGAEWIKEARRHFEGAEVYLDRFHRNKAIRQGLGFSPELLNRAMQAMKDQDLTELKQVLSEGLATAPGEEQVKRVKELRHYLQSNWEGLLDWRAGTGLPPDGARGLGAAEAEINHVLATRMTKRGMSWRPRGAHNLALLRCLDAEGQIYQWLDGWQNKHWPEIKKTDRRHVPCRIIERLSETNMDAYLAGHLPLLANAAGSSDLGRRLKQIIGAKSPSGLVARAGWSRPAWPTHRDSA